MNSESLTHGHAYANDVQYDCLSGYLVGTYISEWTDERGNRWRRTTITVNLGRSDRVLPSNTEAVIADDGMDIDGKPRHERWMNRNTREVHRRITEALHKRPMTVRELSDELGIEFQVVQRLLKNHSAGFSPEPRRASNGGGFIWRLAE